MILFLRSQQNKTIVDCEIYEKDTHTELHCFIDIEEYSKILVEACCRYGGESQEVCELIRDVASLQELRCWLWEMRGSNTAEEYMDIVGNVRDNFLKPLADKYNLMYVED